MEPIPSFHLLSSSSGLARASLRAWGLPSALGVAKGAPLRSALAMVG